MPAPRPTRWSFAPPSFARRSTPWVQLRSSEGHTIEVVSNEGTPDDIRGRIRAANRDAKLRYVLLVGGADPEAARSLNIRRRSVPPYLERAKVDIRWGSEPQIATDNWYADLDGDGVPDIAVGRLPVRSAAELTRVVKKIIVYENGHDFRAWRSRINFLGGLGGFGPMIDGAVQIGARQLVEGGIPSGYRTSLTLADWHSDYCPDPRKFHDTALAGLNDGCWLWVFLGHAGPTALQPLRVPGAQLPTLDCGDVNRLHCAAGAPVALFMACYVGAFDASRRCLGDELLQADGGPVAIVAASRVTMPYGMAVLGAGMLDESVCPASADLGRCLVARQATQRRRRRSSVGPAPLDAGRPRRDVRTAGSRSCCRAPRTSVAVQFAGRPAPAIALSARGPLAGRQSGCRELGERAGKVAFGWFGHHRNLGPRGPIGRCLQPTAIRWFGRSAVGVSNRVPKGESAGAGVGAGACQLRTLVQCATEATGERRWPMPGANFHCRQRRIRFRAPAFSNRGAARRPMAGPTTPHAAILRVQP